MYVRCPVSVPQMPPCPLYVGFRITTAESDEINLEFYCPEVGLVHKSH